LKYCPCSKARKIAVTIRSRGQFDFLKSNPNNHLHWPAAIRPARPPLASIAPHLFQNSRRDSIQPKEIAMENPAKPPEQTSTPSVDPANPIAPRRKRGRPPVIDQRKRDVICALVGFGVSHRLAASYVGVSPATLSRLFRKDPNFHGQFVQAMLNQQLRPLKNLLACGERSWRANAWVLEHLDAQRWGNQPPGRYSDVQLREILQYFAETLAQEVRDPKLKRRLERKLIRFARNPRRELHRPNRRLERQFQRELKRIKKADRENPPPVPGNDWNHVFCNPLNSAQDQKPEAPLLIDVMAQNSLEYDPILLMSDLFKTDASSAKGQRHADHSRD
jgi:hypothetical protein